MIKLFRLLFRWGAPPAVDIDIGPVRPMPLINAYHRSLDSVDGAARRMPLIDARNRVLPTVTRGS